MAENAKDCAMLWGFASLYGYEDSQIEYHISSDTRTCSTKLNSFKWQIRGISLHFGAFWMCLSCVSAVRTCPVPNLRTWLVSISSQR